LWHTQVAKLIYAFVDETADILEDCRAAIQLDKDFGDAYYYKAICHADSDEYDLAVLDMQEACRLHGRFDEYDETIGARWLAKWQEVTGKPDDAIQTLADALKQHPDDQEAVAQYIKLATRTRRFKEVVTFLQNLRSKLPTFLMSEEAEEVHRYIRRTAQMTRRVNSLKRAYEAAREIAKIRRGEEEMARAQRALFMVQAENEEEDKAIELVKPVYQFADDPKQLGDWRNYRGNFCELLFWGAHFNGEGSNSSGEYLSILIELEKNEHSPQTHGLTYENYTGGLYLGLLYRLHNRSYEAKDYFKDRVALAMSFLEDDDIYNDWQAYDILSETLFKAGDRANGRAARILFLHEWRKLQGDDDLDSIAGPTKNERVKATSAASAVNLDVTSQEISGDADTAGETSAVTPWNYSMCDGPCLRDYDDSDKIVHVCMYCYDTTYCEACYKNYIMTDKLPYKKCDSNHEFEPVTGPPKGLKDTKMLLGDGLADRAEWLNSIRRAWDLPESQSETTTVVLASIDSVIENGPGKENRRKASQDGKKGNFHVDVKQIEVKQVKMRQIDVSQL
jgi:hypothetical protein